jgi:hypothetical protein
VDREAEGFGARSLNEKIEQLVREGTVRRIVVRNDQGRTVLDVPVAVGLVAVLMMPMMTVAGSVVALAGGWSIDVERVDPDTVEVPVTDDSDGPGEPASPN